MHKNILSKFKQARINKDNFLKAVLGNLVAELNNEAKASKVDLLDDVKVIEVINKWIKRTTSLVDIYKDKPKALKEAQDELVVHKSLLPKQLTEFEIIEVISNEALNSIPEVMKFFSSKYLGRYESKELLSIFKTISGGH